MKDKILANFKGKEHILDAFRIKMEGLISELLIVEGLNYHKMKSTKGRLSALNRLIIKLAENPQTYPHYI